MNYFEYDTAHICKEHRQLFKELFQCLDLDKVVFVGGIADYLNLRPDFEMPINDIDLTFRSKSHITAFTQRYPMKRHESIYSNDALHVFTGGCTINGRHIHFDFFQQDSVFIRPVAKSELLGQQVLHTSFVGMQAFHNEYIALMSSDEQAENYEWKRLYKHSKKASLYNLLSYRKEKELEIV